MLVSQIKLGLPVLYIACWLQTRNSICLCHLLKYNPHVCWASKVKTWLQILQQSNLKTSYGKDSMRTSSENFGLVSGQSQFQFWFSKITGGLSQFSCYGDVDFWANHTKLSPYLVVLHKNWNFSRRKKKQHGRYIKTGLP